MLDLSDITRANILSARGHTPSFQSLVPYRSFRQLFEHQVDRFEGKTLLVFYGEDGIRKEYTYGEVFEQACQTVNFMAAHGVGPGDRIAVASPNHADVVLLYFAALLLCAVIVPLNIGEDDRRLRFVIEDSAPKMLIARSAAIDRMSALIAGMAPAPLLVECGPRSHTGLLHFQTETVRQPTRLTGPSPDALGREALIVYTSGTTGNPKGVILDQYNLLVDAMAIGEWHQIADDQRMMCVLPLHHVNGIVVTLITPLYAGAGIVLNEKFHADRFFERIAAERVSVVSVVPTLLQFLLHARLDMGAFKLLHFRHIICGAGPLTVELASKFEHTFHIPIIHGYGLSETTCYSCFLPIGLTAEEHRFWMTKHGFPSIGTPLPVNEMTIHDADGHELDEGEKGEIVIRGHNVMQRYFQRPEVNDETFVHGWFRSGDEGFFRYDDLGRKFFFITGRLKELIIRGGVNISPFEIDEVLMSMPGIQAGIGIGFENEWYGEEVGAYVMLRDGVQITPDDVIRFCRKSLPFAKSPKVVVIGASMPVTSTGKYQRARCKDLFTAYRGVQFTEQGV